MSNCGAAPHQILSDASATVPQIPGREEERNDEGGIEEREYARQNIAGGITKHRRHTHSSQ